MNVVTKLETIALAGHVPVLDHTTATLTNVQLGGEFDFALSNPLHVHMLFSIYIAVCIYQFCLHFKNLSAGCG